MRSMRSERFVADDVSGLRRECHTTTDDPGEPGYTRQALEVKQRQHEDRPTSAKI